MAGTSVLKLKVDDKEYNSTLKQAQQGMQHLEQALKDAGKSFKQVDKSVVDYVRGIGQMEAQSKTARGRISEMSNAFVELSIKYNKMSDDVKNSDVGKALAESMEQLKQRTVDAKNELENLNNELNNVKMPEVAGGGLFSDLGDKMGGALQVFAGNMLTKAAGAVANLGSEMVGMVQQGVEMAKAGEGIRIAFERLGRGDILQGLREATHGTVTDLELMKAAVKFNDFKLPLDELGTMLAFAQQKAKDTGQSVDYMVDSIVTGLGRKSLMILDNLGLSATEVKEKMKETGDMTKAVGEIIREQMSKAGDYVETAADRAAQANVSLQNKMEELGRKFAPLQEASNNFWTSMKIGILDVIGGPLTNLLNKLTEAGRLASQYGVLGGNAKVGRMTSNLSNARKDRRQGVYQQQQQQFWKYINPREQQLKDIRAWQSGDRNESLKKRIGAITDKYGSLDATKIQAEVDAAKKMLSDYQQSAKQILQPITQEIVPTVVETTGGGSGKGGGGTTTRAAATPKTEEQQNAARIAELVKQYQDLATAAKTANDAQKAGLTERMTKIQGEITTLQDRNAELKKFADEARQVQYPVGSLPKLNEHLKTLQTDQAKALDAKQWKDYQQQIEQTQYQIDALKGKWKDGLQATFKLNIEQQGSTDINTAKPEDIAVTFKADDADVLAKVRDIDGVTIDPKTLTVTANTAEAYNKVQELLESVDGKTVTFTVQQKMETGTSIQSDAGMSAYIASLKQQLETADYGTSLYNGLSAQLADMTTLQNLVGASLKAGLGTAMFDAADATGKDFWTRAMEGGVENTDWQTIVDKINEKLKSMGIEPIKIPIETVGKDVKAIAKAASMTADVVGSIGDAFNAIEDPAAKVMGTVMQAIASVALGYAQATAQAGSMGPWVWLAFAASGLATMIATISTIHSQTGYAEGGMIKGNSYSGDRIGGLVDGSQLVGLNAGEVVLNAAQQNTLAQNLEGAGLQNLRLEGVISGEKIHIVHNRYLKRSGQGELVTW